jgi:hypothetical protein
MSGEGSKEMKKGMVARTVILIMPLNQTFCYGVRFIAMRTSNGWVSVTFIVKKNNRCYLQVKA